MTYKKIFEKNNYIYFIRISNKNKYYYKANYANNEILDLKKISATEFWSAYDINDKNKLEVKNLTSKEETQEEIEVDQDEIIEEEPKKSFFDLKI